MGRITLPFRTLFRREVHRLRSGYRLALRDSTRKTAFDSLLKAWSSELAAMSYAEIPSVLDVMLLTGLVDNRKLIHELSQKVDALKSETKTLECTVQRM